MDGGIHSPSPVASVNGQVGAVELTGNDILPSQSGNSGKVLGTNGSSVSWVSGGSGSSPLTTKGDIYGYSTTDDRLPVGTNGQVLTADSSQSMGLKWSTPSGTGDMVAATYDPQSIEADAFDLDNMTEGTTNKSFTATEKTKLSGIASGAEVNVNADWNSVSGDSQILNKPTLGTAAATDSTDYATAAQGTLADSALQSVVAGTNVTIDDTDPQNPIISASGSGGGAVDSVNGQTGTVVLDADDIDDTSTTNKFTTSSDISKLAGIESGADVTDATNVAAAGAIMDGDFSSNGLMKRTGSGAYATATSGTDYAPATSGSSILKGNGSGGFTSATAGTDYLAPAAIGSTVEAHDADLTAIAGLSPTNDDVIQRKAGVWTNRTMAQVKTDLALTKSDVGLSSVTNDAQIKSADFPSSSVDSEIALFSSTTGKVVKRASTTGILKGTSGVLSAATAGTDYYAPGSTDVAITDGGTGASSASAARTNLGLGNVDNTSDANKPVSTDQQTLIDDRTNIYGDSFMRTFRAALADKANNPVDMLFIGDSKTEGTTVTAGQRWLDVFRGSFRAHNQPSSIDGGYGYVPACYVASSMTDQFVLTGGATAQTSATGDTHGLGKRSVTMTTTGTATITVGPGTDLGGCTSVDVIYTQNSSQGVFGVSVDGGSITYVTATSGTEVIGQKYSVTGLTNTESHTIQVSWFSGTNTIHGAMLFNGDESAGIRIWESGHSGIKASDVSNTSHKWWKAITTIQPQFIYYQLGRNDIANGASLSTTMTNISNEITFIRTLTTIEPTIIIGMDWKDSLASAVETYQDWYDAMYDFVRTDGNLGLFDLHKVMGDLSTSGENYLGLSDSDLIHASPKGQQTVADAFLAYIESFVESKREKVTTTVSGGYTSWTPSLTNISGGTMNYAVYEQIGKTVHFKLKYTLAGAGISGRPIFSLPVTAASRTASTADVINAVVDLRDANGNAYPGVCAWESTTTIGLYCHRADGTYTSYSAVAAAVPFTWASSDYILINGYYEAA